MKISLLSSTASLEFRIHFVFESGKRRNDLERCMSGVSLSHPIQSLQKHGLQFATLIIQNGDLRPPLQPFLGDDNMQRTDQNMVIMRWRICVQTHF